MNQAKRNRPTFGRTKAQRGLDQFDTPPIALEPLFCHEPLLAGVTTICEPFCGKGNLVTAMRAKGITVHASDIVYRGCPDSTVLDFLEMTQRPDGCDVLVSNPPFAETMKMIEHAFALGFRVVILLLKANFASTEERHERLHPHGHLRRVHVLAERLQGMHDANFTGKKASQPQDHSWFVFDRNYCGPSTNIPVSIKDPTARMPWAEAAPEAGIITAISRPLWPNKEESMTKKASMHVVSEEDSNEAITPINVGNPLAAADLAIDQSHLEEFTTDEEGPPDVTCTKPPKGTFFTVRAETSKPWRDREFYFLLELKDRDSYIVAPHIAKLKKEEDVIRPVLMVRYVTMSGEEGLWALKIDPPDRKGNSWNWSAMTVLKAAEEGRWVRLMSAKGRYHHTLSNKTYEQTPPCYSDRSFKELINIVFGDRMIVDLNHEVWDLLDNGSEK